MIFGQPTFSAVRIIESVEAYEPVEDWSRVRSPSRAERRRRQGHRQNIEIRHKPIALQHADGYFIVHPGSGSVTHYLHPAIADQLRREIKAKMDVEIQRAMMGDPLAPRHSRL